MAQAADNRADEGTEDQVVVGILKKKGEGWMASTKERFIVIDSGQLCYYKNEKDYDLGHDPIKKRSIRLSLYAAIADKGDKSMIRLEPMGEVEDGLVPTMDGTKARTFEFFSVKSEERDDWVEVFEASGCKSEAEYVEWTKERSAKEK